MEPVFKYFLSGYSHDSGFEQKKATFLFYFIICALAGAVGVFISQIILQFGFLYHVSGALALCGICVSLFLFKAKKIEASGHIMAFSVLFMIILQNVFRDIYQTDPAMRYRIYLDAASLIGIYFLIISFFRDNRVIFFYGVMFEIILFTHSLVIYFKLRHLPGMSAFVWQHFATVFASIVALAFISTWFLGYMNTIVQQNNDYAQRVARQKDELEKMVEERTQDLRTSNDKLREFAHIVSHDLKEPLRTISGFVTLIKRELEKSGATSAEMEDYMNHVTRGTRQMEQLISDILSYSRLNTVERPGDVVNIYQVITEAQSLLTNAIAESDAVINIHELPAVTGDRRLLTQLFQNLLSNAIKYRSDNRPPVIHISGVVSKGCVTYSVSDNGIGISEEYFTIVFQAFKRLHSRVNYEGTGIGLAICKKIVDIHRGRIWVESVEGAGTTFFFTLPVAYSELPATYAVVHAA